MRITQQLSRHEILTKILLLGPVELFLLNGLFYYLVMRKCMSSTVRVNGTVQVTFFLTMRLNITIVTSCDSLILILLT